MKRLARVLFLTTIWVLFWGELSLANALSGVCLSLLLITLAPDTSTAAAPNSKVRLVPIARLVALLLAQLLRSNMQVLHKILQRQARLRSAVVVCPLQVPSDRMMTFLANVMSLSPDTIPIALHTEPARIVLHVFDLDEPSVVRDEVALLERRAVEAFGTVEERNLLAAATGRTEAAA